MAYWDTAPTMNAGGSAQFNPRTGMNDAPMLGQAARDYYNQTNNSGTDPTFGVQYSANGKTVTPIRGQDGRIEGYAEYDSNNVKPGAPFKLYGPDGRFDSEQVLKDDRAVQLFIMGLAAAGGMALLGSAVSGAAAASGAGGSGALTAAEIASLGEAGMGAATGAGAGGAAAAGSGALTAAEIASLGEAGMGAATGAGAGAGGAAAAGAAGAAGLTGAGGAAGAAGAAGGLSSLFGPASSLIGPAASLIGGAVSANAAGDAAEQQQQSARDALALSERMFNKTVELNEPFRQTGVQANNRLGDLTGISGRTSAEGYGSLLAPFVFEADPGYAFRKAEQEKALTRRLTARGQLYSGKALKDSMEYSGGLAAQEYGSAFDRDRVTKGDTFNRLSALSGTGQTATGAISNAGSQYGRDGASLITGAGNAAAAGTVGQANAWGNALSNGLSMYQTSQMMDRYFPRGY